jgi:predicted metal-dependent hydrolase
VARRRPRNLALLTDEGLLERLPVIAQGIREFNAGLFFQSHETLEDVWIVSPWPVRNFLQGIIQVAAAFVHLKRNQHAGTHNLLTEAILKLESFTPRYLGVDVERLVADARRCREEILALGQDRLQLFDRQLSIEFNEAAARAETPLASVGSPPAGFPRPGSQT